MARPKKPLPDSGQNADAGPGLPAPEHPAAAQPPPEQPIAETAQSTAQLADDIAARRRVESQIAVTFYVTMILGLIGAAFGNWQVPTLSVCAYAIIGGIVTRREKNIERFADSLYYMGFLFTIWGLLFAFAPWATSIENLSSKTIITQFGIKLITTVVALTARILLIQARAALADEPEEARDTLGAMAKAMAREIEESIKAFRQARDRLLADANAGVTQVHAEAMRNLEGAHRDFHRNTESLLSSVNTAVSQLVTRLAAIEVPPDVLATPLAAAVTTVADEARRLSTGIQQAGAGISQALAESLQRVQQSGERIGGAVQALQSFERLARETESAINGMAAANNVFQETLGRTNQLLTNLGGIVAGLQDSSRQDVDRIRVAIDSAAGELRVLGNTIRQDAQSYSAVLTDSIRVLRGEIERQ